MKKAQGVKPKDVLPGLQVIRDIYNLPRIPVDPEGECHCYYCEKNIHFCQVSGQTDRQTERTLFYLALHLAPLTGSPQINR